MEFSGGEMIASPKTIYWLQAPACIGDVDKVELLKRDVLVLDHTSELNSIPAIRDKKSEYSVFFYNLDSIFIRNHIKQSDYISICNNIAQFVTTFVPEKTIIHTSIIDTNIARVFNNKKILFIEKNFHDRKTAINAALKLTTYLFEKNNTPHRSFIRLNLLHKRYKVEIISSTCPDKVIHGFVKDLSLNGLGVVLVDSEQISCITLKNIIQLKIFMNQQILKINTAIVMRKFEEKNEIGVCYNINDHKMIREDYASKLTSVIYQWIKEFIRHNGSMHGESAELQGS